MDKSKKTLLVGFDGACWEYLDPLLKKGKLANIAALIGRGYRGVLRSVMPPITPVAWSSIVTGVNPGKHGVFEWVYENSATGGIVPVDSKDQKAEPFWRLLNEAGVRVGMVNVPLTHPPRPIGGFVLCGFSSPSAARNLAYPESALGVVEKEFGHYRPDMSSGTRDGDPRKAFADESDFQTRQSRIASYLADIHDVEVLIINLMLLDHANHKQSDMEMVNQAAIDTDRDIGDLILDFEPDNVIIISDHGSRRLDGVFLMGAWLREHGYLCWKGKDLLERCRTIHFLLGQLWNHRDSPLDRLRRWALSLAMAVSQGLFMASRWAALEQRIPLAILQATHASEVDRSRSTLYPIGARRGNLRWNRNHAVSQDRDADSSRRELIARVADQLAEVLDPSTGRPLFTDLHDSRTKYSGPFTTSAPDLIGDYYNSRWGVAMKLPALRPRSTRYFLSNPGLAGWFGDHSPDGIFVAAGRDFRAGRSEEPLSILDIAPTLLYLYDVALPEEYDGRPLLDAIRPELRAAHAPRMRRGEQQGNATRRPSSSIEEPESQDERDHGELLRRLADLGYIE